MSDILSLTAGIVAAHVENNRVHTAELSTLIQSVHQALAKLGEPEPEPAAEKPKGAVTARKSLASPEGIISMIDGKSYKTLKRHIAKHGYTPESYRTAFSLPSGYPMVAPTYSEHRRAVAKTVGLGRRKVEEVATPVVEAVAEPVKKVARKVRKGVGQAIEAARDHLPGS